MMMDKNNEIISKSKYWQQKNKNSTAKLGFWSTAWVLSMALTNFGPQFIWDLNISLTVIAVLLNLALGLKMVLANIAHIKALDEMQQRIQLNAIGITLGLSLVVGLTFSNMDVLDLITFHADIAHFVIFMGLTCITAIFIGNRKYQ
jgi:hypothetical protein